jgi:uncharacterized membrane protein YkoI
MRIQFVLGAVSLLGITGAIAFAQVDQSLEEEQAGLRARVTYSLEAARAQALAAVPGGTLMESEIEEEDGRLIYCFEIKGPDGVTEVEIDAVTGALIGTEAEDDDDADSEDRDED